MCMQQLSHHQKIFMTHSKSSDEKPNSTTPRIYHRQFRLHIRRELFGLPLRPGGVTCLQHMMYMSFFPISARTAGLCIRRYTTNKHLLSSMEVTWALANIQPAHLLDLNIATVYNLYIYFKYPQHELANNTNCCATVCSKSTFDQPKRHPVLLGPCD